MAVEYISWALQQKIPSGQKFVLVALANRANQDGECWPSQKDISRQTSMSERTVRQHISWLCEHGLITKEKRRRKNGSYTSDRFVIQRKYSPEAEFTEGEKSLPPTAKSAAPEPSLYSSLRDEKETSNTQFEEFWLAYPRKVKKKQTKSTYEKILKKCPHNLIMYGLEKYKSGKPDYADWRHPTTWLNDEGWNDEYGDTKNGCIKQKSQRKYSPEDAGRDALRELGLSTFEPEDRPSKGIPNYRNG